MPARPITIPGLPVSSPDTRPPPRPPPLPPRPSLAARSQGVPGSASAFYAVTLAEALGAMPRVTAASVPRLLPYLEAGLAPAASAEQYAGALIVTAQLASRANLAGPLTEALLEGVAKGARAPLRAQALQALLCLCRTQAVATLPSRAFKHLAKLPELASHFSDLCRGYRADAGSRRPSSGPWPRTRRRTPRERTLAAVVKEAPLSDDAVNALVDALAELATFTTTTGSDLRNKDPTMNPKGLEEDERPEEEEETRRAIASRVLRLTDAYHPAATSRAVDRLLARNEREKRREAEAETETETETARASSHHPAASSAASRATRRRSSSRRALAGSASGPMPRHAASLGAALDHPSAGLREAALRELRRGGVARRRLLLLWRPSRRRVVLPLVRGSASPRRGRPPARRRPGGVASDATFGAPRRGRRGVVRRRARAARTRGVGVRRPPDAELERAAGKRLAGSRAGRSPSVRRRRGEATRGDQGQGRGGRGGRGGGGGGGLGFGFGFGFRFRRGGRGGNVGGAGPVGGAGGSRGRRWRSATSRTRPRRARDRARDARGGEAQPALRARGFAVAQVRERAREGGGPRQGAGAGSGFGFGQTIEIRETGKTEYFGRRGREVEEAG